jgi:hypothetical protein
MSFVVLHLTEIFNTELLSTTEESSIATFKMEVYRCGYVQIAARHAPADT